MRKSIEATLAGGVGVRRLIAANDATRLAGACAEPQSHALAAEALTIRAVASTRATLIRTSDERAWGRMLAALAGRVSTAKESRVELANAVDTLIRAA